MYQEQIEMPVQGMPVNIKMKSNLDGWVGSGMHFHREIEILRVEHGKMELQVDSCKELLEPGDILLLNAMVAHRTDVLEEDTSITVIQFHPENLISEQYISEYKYLYEFTLLSKFSWKRFSREYDVTRQLNGYVDDIREEFIRHGEAFELFVKADIYRIFGFLYRNHVLSVPKFAADEQHLRKVENALHFIEKNFRRHITLEQLCEVTNFAPAYFCRVFKRATGRTFVEYLNFVRVQEAEKQLLTSGRSITEVAMDAGFSSISYFNRIFGKYKNCSPTAYRKMYDTTTLPEKK